MVEIKSLIPGVASSVTWYGNLVDFGNIEGYLHDYLDYENPDNELVTFLGNIGEKTAYVRCGLNECDVYYAEVLAG